MDREPLEFDDEALTRYFRGANEALEADEFAASVLRRAQHRARRRELIRQVVLGAATVIALTIALQPMAATLQDFARVLLAAADEWHDAAWYRDRALVACAALAMAGWPFVARWLAR
jgi:hypothetical protein